MKMFKRKKHISKEKFVSPLFDPIPPLYAP